MGYFWNKTDPVSERARTLKSEIAALEAQIHKLAGQEKAARKQGQNGRAEATNRRTSRRAAAEAVFETLATKPAQARVDTSAQESLDELRARPADLPGTVRKLVKHFKGPPPSNPRLVNYLAAGSIQGLRPMRYEKRVARNRVVFFVVFLVLLLLGILKSAIGH